MVILVRNCVGDFFPLGYFGGEVMLDSLSPQFLGCNALSSFSAEVSGLLWGMVWRVQAPSCAPTRFHVDNMAAVMKTKSLWAGIGEPQAVKFRVFVFSVLGCHCSIN